jgi:hypothetical protein
MVGWQSTFRLVIPRLGEDFAATAFRHQATAWPIAYLSTVSRMAWVNSPTWLL